MALFGTLDTVRSQLMVRPEFQVAFDYVKEALTPGTEAAARLAGMEAGKSQKIDLAAGVFTIDQVYHSKARPDGFFESHRKYIDVQVILSGEEVMEVTDISRLPVKAAYAEERDVIIYGDAANASILRMRAGDIAVFFPVDGHMPSLQTGAGSSLVRKTVVKVPVA